MAKKHDKRAVTFRTIVIFVIIFIVGSFAVVRLSDRNGDSDLRYTLAQCLTDSGAVMYGAYWCPNCSKQKKDFGSAFSKIDYIECAVPGNPRGQTQECEDAGITGYPTWEFADGERLIGLQPLASLAEQAGCPWGSHNVEPADETVEAAPDEGTAAEGSETVEENADSMMEEEPAAL